jgi:cytochrome c biogenesis protein CcmG/thiol:disulfide interchange protein DsbE
MKLKFLIPLGLFLVLVGFLGVGLKLNPREVPSPLIGKPAPAFDLAVLGAGGAVGPQRIRREDMLGKVWMLNVWASWCPACRDEHPLLVDFARRKTVPLLGLDYKDTDANAQAWLDRFGNPYDAVLVDPQGRIGIDWGVYGVPETFIIDKQGVVRFKQIGPVTSEALRDRIEPLLKELST